MKMEIGECAQLHSLCSLCGFYPIGLIPKEQRRDVLTKPKMWLTDESWGLSQPSKSCPVDIQTHWQEHRWGVSSSGDVTPRWLPRQLNLFHLMLENSSSTSPQFPQSCTLNFFSLCFFKWQKCIHIISHPHRYCHRSICRCCIVRKTPTLQKACCHRPAYRRFPRQ